MSINETNAMSEDNKRKWALVPRLRFSEFREAGGWGAILGNQVFDQISNKDHNSDLPVLAITQEQGAIPRELIDYHVSVSDKSIESYKVVEIGDFIISLRSFQGGIEYSRYKGICSPAYVILRLVPGHSADYFRHFLKTDRFIGQLTKNLEGLRDGKMVSYKQFSELQLPTPSQIEQQKIADCLSSLDELITAETQKLDALKTHKKGMQQQLFPLEGETVPRLRFPEFRNAAEWEEKSIGEKLDLLSGFPFDGPDIGEDASGVPLMRGINITEGFIRHNQDIDRFFCGSPAELEKYRLRENDLVIGMDGSKVGKNSALVTEADAGALLVQRVARLRSSCETTIRFVFQHINSNNFHTYVDRINTSSGIPHISLKQISEFKICFPEAEEQQRIVECLSYLDDLITAQSHKVDALKTHKQGLMQQLFPVLNEVQA